MTEDRDMRNYPRAAAHGRRSAPLFMIGDVEVRQRFF
jgi:hypothetical protein